MKLAITAFRALGLVPILALATLGASQEPNPLTPQELQSAIDVQSRGPIHEAYAQPVTANAQPSAPTPKEPPAAIPEEPPEQRPEADNAQWIPGYWAWDAERQEYLWVSGVYRVPPQGRTFVPGYWTETPEGWRWVAGFWAPTQQDELPYTPQPPAPLDNGPSLPPPDDDSTYIQGTWVYRDPRWVWRPGFYAPFRSGRLWNSPHYVWTPRGYLFIDGYWDYPLEDRGLLFAPVCFRQPLWRNPGWSYQPSFVVGIGAFFDTGFVRAGCAHYYFGNYYGADYARLGYSPWFRGSGRYDPAFAYYGVQNSRTNPNFVANAQRTFAGRSAGTLAAPPMTLAQQNAQVAVNAKAPRVIAPLAQATTVNSPRLVQASPTQVTSQRTFAQQTRTIASTRRQLDAASNTGAGSAGASGNSARSLSLPTVLQGVGTSPGGTLPKNRPTSATNPTPAGPTIINGTSSNPTPSKGKTQPRVDIQPMTPRTGVPQPLVNTPSVPSTIATPQPQINLPATPKTVAPLPQKKNTPSAPSTIVTPQPQINLPAMPKTVAPLPQKNNTPSAIVTPQPQINLPATPKTVAPQPQPRSNVQPPPPPPKTVAPQPQPRINVPAPTPPKTVAPQPQPRFTPPPAQPRISTPPPRANPSPRVTAPVSQPRVQSAPTPQPNNPPPAKASNPATNKKR